MRRRSGYFIGLPLLLSGCLSSAERPVALPKAVTVVEPKRTRFAEFPSVPGTYIGHTPAPPVTPPPVEPISVPVPPTPPQKLASTTYDPPVVAALRSESQGQPDAEDQLKKLPQPDRDLVLRLIRTTLLAEKANFATPGTRKIQVVADNLAQAQATVANYAPLVLVQALFVEHAAGFSRYTPLPRNHHYPPQGLAELYVELHNARPAPIGPKSDQFEVRFRWKLTLSRSLGGPPSQETAGIYAVPPTRSPVRDCHFTLPIPVPDRPGTYWVTVEVQDMNRPPNAFVVSNRTKLEVAGANVP